MHGTLCREWRPSLLAACCGLWSCMCGRNHRPYSKLFAQLNLAYVCPRRHFAAHKRDSVGNGVREILFVHASRAIIMSLVLLGHLLVCGAVFGFPHAQAWENETVTRPLTQSVNQPVHQRVKQAGNHCISQARHVHATWSFNKSISRSFKRS